MWEEGDPEGILSAVRQFYDLKSIEWAKRAGLNWLWVTWSVGFSHETERPQWDLLRPYIAECHKNGIHVTAYISGANMFHADMEKHVPDSRNWWKLDNNGKPVPYSAAKYSKYGVTRYMADVQHPQWLPYQRVRIREALNAGADGFWVDNIGTSQHEEGITGLVEIIMEEGRAVGKVPVVCFNMHVGSLAIARCMNALSTEDGVEPGYYPAEPRRKTVTRNEFSAHEADTRAASSGLVCNVGLLKYQYAVSEGWRPSAVECGRRHAGASRMVDVMAPETWQLALAECQAHHASLEPFFEGILLRDISRGDVRALACLDAMGAYNCFFARHAGYLAHPHSLARVGIFSESRNRSAELKLVRFLNELSACQAQYDVVLDMDAPAPDRYDVFILPGDMEVCEEWKKALTDWASQGGTVLTWGDTEKQLRKLEVAGAGRIIVLPGTPTPRQIADRIKELTGAREAVTLEAPPFVLMNAVRQVAEKRTVVHILNYQQQPCSDIQLLCVRGGGKAKVFSADFAETKTVAGLPVDGKTLFRLPPVRIYSLVVIPDE